MNVDKCCKNCEHFSKNFYSNLGICREYEGLVNPKNRLVVGIAKQRKEDEKNG